MGCLTKVNLKTAGTFTGTKLCSLSNSGITVTLLSLFYDKKGESIYNCHKIDQIWIPNIVNVT